MKRDIKLISDFILLSVDPIAILHIFLFPWNTLRIRFKMNRHICVSICFANMPFLYYSNRIAYSYYILSTLTM